jgi:UDP-N-acetylmuramate dehydrogenase
VPLAPLTTLGIGGPARFFVEARTEGNIVAALRYADSRGLNVFILGGGSNILVSDAGFDGLVVRISLKGITELRSAATNDEVPANAVIINAQAGEDWDRFVEQCVGRGLAGVECLSGIPGSVGGTPVQNVGAYGQEVSETILSVRCLDRSSGKITVLDNSQCGFSYRKGIFNTTSRDRYIVLSVTFRLTPGGPPKITYKDLKEHFAGRGPTVAEARDAVLAIRAAKSMVIDPADPNSRSAGSFFKNPIVDRSMLAGIAAKASVDAVPHFEAGGEMVKVPAAWLIERSGFYKGFTMGNVGISTNHSLALVNRGGAKAADVVELKDRITATVEEIFGISLVPEPVFVGF